MNSIVYKKEEGGSAHVIIALDVSPLSAGQCCHRKPIAYESLSSAHLPRPQGSDKEKRERMSEEQRLKQTIQALTDSFINRHKEGDDNSLFFSTKSYRMASRIFNSYASYSSSFFSITTTVTINYHFICFFVHFYILRKIMKQQFSPP